ncbi:MAG: hypothetical protein ABIH49_00330 [archaeon]
MNRLSEVRYEEGIAAGHYDHRRNIDDPLKLFDGLEGTWHPHGIITLKQEGLDLGNHHHDYDELYFSPTGGFNVWLVDEREPKDMLHFRMTPGSRLLLPEYVAHRVVGEIGSVLLTYGNVPFNSNRILKSSTESLELLAVGE